MPATMFATGKRPPKNAKALMLSRYHTVASETYPDVDYSTEYADWQITLDGNGEAGDCVPCGTLNTRRLDSAVLDGVPAVFDIAKAWQLYETQNEGFDPNGTAETNGPGSSFDQGMDIQTLLEWLLTDAGNVMDKRLVGFVKVTHTDMQEICAGISLGGSLMVGGTVTDTQQTEFPGTWTWDPKGKNPGGHCFLLTGHRMVNGKRVYKGVCWAAAFDITEEFLVNALDEAWLLIWEDMLDSVEFMAQMDVATFAADVSSATGEPFPVAVTPVDPPAPAPVDPPAPVPAPEPTPTPVVVDPPVIAEPGEGATLVSNTVTVEGEADAGVTVTLLDGDSHLGSTQATDAGLFSLTVSLANGIHTLWTTATDPDGNESSSSVAVTVTVAVPAPPAPEPSDDPDEIFAHFLHQHIVNRVRIEYQTRIELERHAKAWLAARDL